MKGNIHSIETFGTVDGPGVRYVIFMQGCNFRCSYCHNPDTWECGKGTWYTVDEVLEDVVKYKRYIEGITVTGGEPLLQLEFVTELFSKAKSEGLTTCVDTSGSIFNYDNKELVSKLDNFLDVCDLVMLDIKHIDNTEHIKLTGNGNENILAFAEYLSKKNKDMWLRYVLVPTINDQEHHLKNWKLFADKLNNVKKIELLPYHKLALNKYQELGIEYKLKDIDEPTTEQIFKAKKILGIMED